MIIIIIPYRNDNENIRKNHLNSIIPHLEKQFKKINFNDYKILVIEQSDDNRKFNRGSLLNIGFIESMKYSKDHSQIIHHIITHDVDLLPDDDMIINYIDVSGSDKSVYHYAHNRISKYNYPDFFGAVNGFTPYVYKVINGFPNCFWGWGGEDDAVMKRLKFTKLKNIKTFKDGNYDELKHGHDKTQRFDKKAKKKLLKDQFQTYKKDGLSTIDYDILKRDDIGNFTEKINVHIHNSCYHIETYNLDSKTNCEDYRDAYKVLFYPILSEKDEIEKYIFNLRKKYNLPYQILPHKDLSKNIKSKLLDNIFKNNNNNFNNTFQYVFNKLHKGIYVKIVNNRIKAFNLIINQNPKLDGDLKLSDNYKYSTNNCLIEKKDKKDIFKIWGTVYTNFFYLLRKTLDNRKVRDCEFFYNKRDFPVIRKRGDNIVNPHFMLYEKDKEPIIEYDSLIPILGSCSGKSYLDIPIPTPDDIDFVFKKFFPYECVNLYHNNIIDSINFDDKKDIGVFRGKATGCGTTSNNNQRLKLIELGENNRELLNVGITGINPRNKYYYGKINKIDFKTNKSKYLSRQEQFQYKYIINVDGHVRAYRLSYELQSNSIVLLVKSKYDYELFYEDQLEEYVHYIPIKKDLSNLIEQIKWCKTNQDKVKDIIKNANNLMRNIMSKKYFYDYMSIILNSI
jgi:hypothetical protein